MPVSCPYLPLAPAGCSMHRHRFCRLQRVVTAADYAKAERSMVNAAVTQLAQAGSVTPNSFRTTISGIAPATVSSCWSIR